jgi:serine/threonine-protein kinase HipA
MSYSHVERIKVICWGQVAGYLAYDQANACYAFEYDHDFQRRGIEIAPLAAPLRTLGPQVFPYLDKESFQGLPAFIADCLPDRFGNDLIDRWMATHEVEKASVTPLDRLAYMGKRGMGALEFEPELRTGEKAPFALDIKDLVEAARSAMGSQIDDSAGLRELISVGTSAGGMRAKAVVGYDPKERSFISGQFELPDGYEHWLIKFDIQDSADLGPSRDYGRIEYAYALMAADAGIEMAPCMLYEAGGRAHFMTKRFDRSGNDKLHIQSLFAMAELDYRPMAHSYEQFFMTARQLGLGYEAIDAIFDRMVFNVAAINYDDHVKNHSFLLTPDGTWRLSPAYDLSFAYNPNSPWTAQQALSVNGKFSDIQRTDLLAVGRKFAVADPSAHIQKILGSTARWLDFAQSAGVSGHRAQEINRRLQAECGKLTT